ncbi:MAG: SBBP repeat-containing protein [Acidobacteria bacterium]|nr:SBBP repeat-containing protein [Acidobacteriota bacterium]
MRILTFLVLQQVALAAVPLEFEGHEGAFLARASGYQAYFGKDGVSLTSRADQIRMSWRGRAVAPVGAQKLAGVSHYFNGGKEDWRTGVPHYARVRYEAVQTGIDLEFHRSGNQIEFDWLVAPGAHPEQIAMRFDGAADVRIDEAGDLILQTGATSIRQKRPAAWQIDNGSKRLVGASFQIGSNGEVGFALDSYDPALPLVIDPVIGFGTYVGGNSIDGVTGVALDTLGRPVVVGQTNGFWSTGTPSYGAIANGVTQAFFCKLNESGSAIVFCGFFGTDTNASNVVLDAANQIYIVGSTKTNLPFASETVHGTSKDGFLVKFNSAGSSPLWGHLYGGDSDDQLSSVQVSSLGYVYIGGANYSVSGFPSCNNPNQGSTNAFVARFTTAGVSSGCTFIQAGQGIGIEVRGMALTSDNYVIAAGNAYSPALSAGQKIGPGGGVADGFVAKISTNLGTVLWIRAIGGADYDYAHAVTTDASGNIYVAGLSHSPDFPMLNALQAPSSGDFGFLFRLSPAGALTYSTALHGGNSDFAWANSIAIRGENIYVGGRTNSATFPANATSAWTLGSVFGPGPFLVKFQPGLSGIQYSATMFGPPYGTYAYMPSRLAVNASGAFLTGSHRVATTAGALKSALVGDNDGNLVMVAETANLRISVKAYAVVLGHASRKITYTFTVTNDGPDWADGVRVWQATPSGTTFSSVAAACNNSSLISVNCSLGGIAPGASVSFAADYLTAALPGTVIGSTANASTETYDPNSANNVFYLNVTLP